MISARCLLQGSGGRDRGLQGMHAGTYRLPSVSSLLIPCSFTAPQACIVGAGAVRTDFQRSKQQGLHPKLDGLENQALIALRSLVNQLPVDEWSRLRHGKHCGSKSG